jgi:hypothetical protein
MKNKINCKVIVSRFVYNYLYYRSLYISAVLDWIIRCIRR